jgi:hypothetical protein
MFTSNGLDFLRQYGSNFTTLELALRYQGQASASLMETDGAVSSRILLPFLFGVAKLRELSFPSRSPLL